MRLNILERIMCLQMLPEKGSFVTLRAIQEAHMKLSFTEEELKEYNIQTKDGSITWDAPPGTEVKDIDLGATAIDAIKKHMKELDESEQLTPKLCSVYEKFMVVEEKAEVKNGSD